MTTALLAQLLAQVEPARPGLLEAVLQYIVAPLLPLIGAAVVGALGKLVLYLHAREAESRVARIAAVFAEGARSIVAELDATLRPQLAEALADGVLTAAEKAKLKEAALLALRSKLPPALLEQARGVFGPLLDSWLGGLVERAVTDRRALQGDPT
jgi:hypothetical protein